MAAQNPPFAFTAPNGGFTTFSDRNLPFWNEKASTKGVALFAKGSPSVNSLVRRLRKSLIARNEENARLKRELAIARAENARLAEEAMKIKMALHEKILTDKTKAELESNPTPRPKLLWKWPR